MAKALLRVAGASIVLSVAGVCIASCAQSDGSEADAELAARVDLLESKEEIRSLLLGFAEIVDEADVEGLAALVPRLHRGFRMDVVDFTGAEHRFVGAKGLVEGYGPIMVAARANLAASAIAVEIYGDRATASFDFVNSVQPPAALGLAVEQKVLLLADNTATFVREDGVWKLATLELVHSLAYPGTLPAAGP